MSASRVFEDEENPVDLLDEVENPGERFGSYDKLIQLKDYRFREFYKRTADRRRTSDNTDGQLPSAAANNTPEPGQDRSPLTGDSTKTAATD